MNGIVGLGPEHSLILWPPVLRVTGAPQTPPPTSVAPSFPGIVFSRHFAGRWFDRRRDVELDAVPAKALIEILDRFTALRPDRHS